MARNPIKTKRYQASYFGPDEVKMQRKFLLQRDDAKAYFLDFLKPRMDRSYKLYVSYMGDRAREIQEWQANVGIPYVMATIETMKPRILDARPDFTVLGRTEKHEASAEHVQQLCDYTWEKAGMDDQTEDLVSASMIFGSGFMQTFYKKDVRHAEFLKKGQSINKTKKTWVTQDRVMYDAPCAETVDNYGMMYDWRNTTHETKQFWFRRMILNGESIRRRYPNADPTRLDMAFAGSYGDLRDYGTIRYETKSTHSGVYKGAERAGFQDRWNGPRGGVLDKYQLTGDPDLQFFEVLEWQRPFEDKVCVEVGDVPILADGEEPFPYDFKETNFTHVPFLRVPFEYEGLGYPMMLEQPALMMNLIKNQRLDAAVMSIHKMWIVNPLANIKKEQLVTRPFGIIWSSDPNGVKPVEFSDIKESAYREESMLKADMQHISGVDDASQGVGGGANSATETRHLRESTMERIRLYINHLGSAYSSVMRQWISMYAQFMTDDIQMRITGSSGESTYGHVTKDDVKGEFDIKASVLPSIAGKSDVDKKQNMDLFQLLIQLPFIDQKKLVNFVTHPFGVNINRFIMKEQDGVAPGQGVPGSDPNAQPDPAAGGLPPELAALMGGAPPQPPPPSAASTLPPAPGGLTPEAIQGALALLSKGRGEGPSPFAEAGAPLPMGPGTPPTAPPIGGTTNPRGLSKGAGSKPNTTINRSGRGSSGPGGNLLTAAQQV